MNYLDAYITTALWSSLDRDDNPLDDNYSIDDLAPESVDRANKDIQAFINAVEKQGLDTSDHEYSQVMYDFWLTRNGHGTGFWDGDYEKILGDKLTDICEKIGSVDLYVGDDNKLYFM